MLLDEDYIELRAIIEEFKKCKDKKEKKLLAIMFNNNWLIDKFAMGMIFGRPSKKDEELAGEILEILEY